MIDLQLIDKGQFYKELIKSYIIFICPFDVFGKGAQNNVSKELKAFLAYVAGRKSEDSFVEKLEEAVKNCRI